MGYKEASDEAIALKIESNRYRFIRDVLVQCMDPRMDGTFVFRVRSPHGRARTFDEVVDNMMKELGHGGHNRLDCHCNHGVGEH